MGPELITAKQAVKIRVFPNQNRLTELSGGALVARTAAYNGRILSGGMSTYKAACFELRKTVKAAQRQSRDKMEADFSGADPAEVCKGPSNLHTGKTHAEMMPSPTFCIPPSPIWMKGGTSRVPCSVVFLSRWRILVGVFFCPSDQRASPGGSAYRS